MLGLALLVGLCWAIVADASEVAQVRVETGATGTRAELSLPRESEFKVISLSNPDRLVIDLPGVALRQGLQLPAGAGLVRSVRNGQPEPGVTRIVFDLAEPTVALTPRFEPGADGVRLVIEWPGDGTAPASAAAVDSADPIADIIAQLGMPSPADEAGSAAPPAASAGADHDPDIAASAAASNAATQRLIAELALAQNAPAEPSASVPVQPSTSADPPASVAAPTAPPAPPPASAEIAATPAVTPSPADAGRDATSTARGATRPPDPLSSAMRELVIAIDAGHGGRDPGAVGPTGHREKDITLAIARELAVQVNATPGLRAYLTRDSDVFIPLPERSRLARAAGADMFISIHADAAENRNARGSSVYVLSLRGASSQRARWLADKENAADLIGGVQPQQVDDTLTSVLLDLTQSGQMRASEDAGSHILDGLKRIGNNHKPNIERANFAVLRTSDMPAMLVETAFLSNPEEERRLINPDFQRNLARAMLDGVNTYFSSQPPPGTLFAMRAAADAAARSSGGSP